MKLRNKKTGEIVERVDLTIREDGVVFNNDETYNSLAELNEEWEDVLEEPKTYWGVDYSSCRVGGIDEFSYDNDNIDKFNKAIGNYFETKEEAEKAVEKLKAWKRLKDKGFRFKGLTETHLEMDCIEFDIDDIRGMQFRDSETRKDLDLLFGGEE